MSSTLKCRDSQVHDNVLHLQCSHCKAWKEAEGCFYKLATTTHGYNSWCKLCMNAQRTARRREMSSRESRPQRGRRVVEGRVELTCTKCRAWKPEGDYSVVPNVSSGRGSWCKPCVGQKSRETKAARQAAVVAGRIAQGLPADGRAAWRVVESRRLQQTEVKSPPEAGLLPYFDRQPDQSQRLVYLTESQMNARNVDHAKRLHALTV